MWLCFEMNRFAASLSKSTTRYRAESSMSLLLQCAQALYDYSTEEGRGGSCEMQPAKLKAELVDGPAFEARLIWLEAR